MWVNCEIPSPGNLAFLTDGGSDGREGNLVLQTLGYIKFLMLKRSEAYDG